MGNVSDTLYVNLFGGPGCGKSTTAAGVFSLLKLHGINAELVTEYAKDLVWEGSIAPLDWQPVIFGEQFRRMLRLDGKVQVVVVDSPLVLGLIYGGEEWADAEDLIVSGHQRFRRVNFLLNRAKPYQSAGRLQSLTESMAIDAQIHCLLASMGESAKPVNGDLGGINTIVKDVLGFIDAGHLQYGIIDIHSRLSR